MATFNAVEAWSRNVLCVCVVLVVCVWGGGTHAGRIRQPCTCVPRLGAGQLLIQSQNRAPPPHSVGVCLCGIDRLAGWETGALGSRGGRWPAKGWLVTCGAAASPGAGLAANGADIKGATWFETGAAQLNGGTLNYFAVPWAIISNPLPLFAVAAINVVLIGAVEKYRADGEFHLWVFKLAG